MVGPVSNDERQSFTRRLKIGFVVLVGVSAGLITLQGDPTPVVLAGAVVGGLFAGTLLVQFAIPSADSFRDQNAPERGSESEGHLERRFESEERDQRPREKRNQ
ncbi:hypothetical protein [Halorientalis regularis]|jgi:hypothetical protein|uniref:Uncharacterized protein n=1 Tax=Halorientalis regularis TaxID=660518 RepID=A0A1G7MUQ4_9EURY|nr:hypothetical protein [Halorientalis regularis]SDF65427.1 hypothetical protein SAMN05216218_10870 [Halorientalis regularis]